MRPGAIESLPQKKPRRRGVDPVMDTVTILRRLWRFRLLVALVALLSVIVAVWVSFRFTFPTTLESRKYDVGVASARILVDTPESQVVDLTPKGSDSLGSRANLLASLMVDGDIEQIIARKAGLRPSQIVATGPAMNVPASTSVRPNRYSYVLSTQVTTIADGAYLPIIEISTQAPTADQAQRLANAAVDGLREYLDSKAASQAIPDGNRLRIGGLSSAQARVVTRGPRMIFSIAALLFMFVAGCAAILFVSGIVRGLRTPEAERLAATRPREAPVPEADPVPEAAPAAVVIAEEDPPAAPTPISTKRVHRPHAVGEPQARTASWSAGGPPA